MFFVFLCLQSFVIVVLLWKRNVIGVAIVRSKSSPFQSSPVVQSTDYRQPEENIKNLTRNYNTITIESLLSTCTTLNPITCYRYFTKSLIIYLHKTDTIGDSLLAVIGRFHHVRNIEQAPFEVQLCRKGDDYYAVLFVMIIMLYYSWWLLCCIIRLMLKNHQGKPRKDSQ